MCDLFLCDCESINKLRGRYYPSQLGTKNGPCVDSFTVSTWSENNYLKANSVKSHLLTMSDNVLHINDWGNQLSSGKFEELLGMAI